MEFSKIQFFQHERVENESRKPDTKYMRPLSSDYPKLAELERIYDGKEHSNIILICESANDGLATAGRILNSCLSNNIVADSEDYDIDDVLDIFGGDEEEIAYATEEPQLYNPNTEPDAFLVINESEISTACNEIGDWEKRKEKSNAPQHDISGQDRIIIVCDGMFALTDMLVSQLKKTTGRIIVIIPKNKANTERINDLIFCKNFECYEIPARTRQYYEGLLVQYLGSQGFECLADTSAIISNLMEFRKNQFHEYDIKILADKAIARSEAKREPWKALWDDDFQIDSFKRDATTGDDLLKKIIGLDKVKEMIKTQCAIALQNKRMAEHTGIADDTYKSIAFKGAAGTGKSTIARAVSKIYAEAGITNGSFIEVSRGDLVGSYVGESSHRVMKVFEQVVGGVLFIEEAGTLVTGTDAWDKGGTEALGAIVRHMDCYPQTVVIFATYDDEMERLFEVNEGLKSRISNIITFEGYSTEQLIEIFKSMAKSKGYTIAPGYKKVIVPYFDKVKKMESFGNGRDVRKLLESAIGVMAVQNKKFSTTIPLSAIRKAVAEALENQSPEKNRIGFSMDGHSAPDA